MSLAENISNITTAEKAVSAICRLHQEPQLIFGGVMIAIIIVGLVGNCTVLSTILILKEYKKSVTNWYILQLAMADTLFIIMLPLTASSAFAGKWNYPEWVCKLKEGVIFINYYASIYFLVIMSFDRYLAVTKAFASNNWVTSLRSPKASYVISAIGWIVSVLACTILFQNSKVGGCQQCAYSFGIDESVALDEFGTSIVNDSILVGGLEPDSYFNIIDFFQSEHLNDDYFLPNDEPSKTDVESSAVESSASGEGPTEQETLDFLRNDMDCRYKESRSFLAWVWSNFIIAFIFPLLLICFFYGMIMRTIMQAGSVGNALPQQRTYRRRVTMIVLALVTLFVLTWLPWYIVKLALMDGVALNFTQCTNLKSAVRAIAYLNSAFNPYFYSFLGTKFRDRVIRASRKVKVTSTSRPRTGSGSSRRKRKYSTSNSGSNKALQMQAANPEAGKETWNDEMMKGNTVQRTERTILS